MEAAFAGTSFVGIPDLDGLRYGSEHMNITSDGTIEGGLGSLGFDDEGVAAQRVDLVKDGILVGFQSSRETAAAMGADRSNGTMRAEGWENFPLIRMTNINILPGEGSLEDLIADVDDGIFMSTNKSWSIDDKRKNFQFGCEIAWEIRGGRRVQMYRDPVYAGTTPKFWGGCDAISGPEAWRLWGLGTCGKGEPMQLMRVGHGCAPARFRGVEVGSD
jgi:TldD protein